MAQVRVDLWLDLTSLPSYLALRNFRIALADREDSHSFRASPRPFFGSPQTTPESLQAASTAGITIAHDLPDADSHPAQQLLVGLEDAGSGADTVSLKLAEALMRSYFELGLDISQEETLIGIGQDFGIKAETTVAILRDPVPPVLVQEAFTVAVHLGIETAPVFLLEDSLVIQEATVDAFHAAFTTIQESAND